MPSFETLECDNCEKSFTAHPSAQAAQTSYCSPSCHSDGEGL